MITLKSDRYFHRFEDITPELLKAEDVQLLLCDLDNTLRLQNEEVPSQELKTWVETCSKNGTKIVIVTNNVRKKKLKKFCSDLNVPCIGFAKKPLRLGLTKSIRKFGDPSTTVMLGDKISTDVLAARFAGIRAWRVMPRKKIL